MAFYSIRGFLFCAFILPAIVYTEKTEEESFDIGQFHNQDEKEMETGGESLLRKTRSVKPFGSIGVPFLHKENTEVEQHTPLFPVIAVPGMQKDQNQDDPKPAETAESSGSHEAPKASSEVNADKEIGQDEKPNSSLKSSVETSMLCSLPKNPSDKGQQIRDILSFIRNLNPMAEHGKTNMFSNVKLGDYDKLLREMTNLKKVTGKLKKILSTIPLVPSILKILDEIVQHVDKFIDCVLKL